MVTVDELSSSPLGGAESEARECVAHGNAAFVDGEFATAAAAYSAALQMIQAQGLPKELAAEVYASRAQAHIQLEDFVNAVDDSNRALEANPKLHKAFLRKVGRPVAPSTSAPFPTTPHPCPPTLHCVSFVTVLPVCLSPALSLDFLSLSSL